MSAVISAVVALAVTALATPVVIRLAVRTDMVDHPGPLKPHQHPVPYLGGVAVFLGLAAGFLGTAAGGTGSGTLSVLVPLALALALGLVDDATDLPVLPRLLAELGIGAGVAWVTGAQRPVDAVGVALATVVLINATNMVDGIDGLALGMAAVCALGFAVLAPGGWTGLAAATMGACAGLLLFNRPPAKIYLGDAGSYLLGTTLAVLAGAAWSASSRVSDLVVVVAVLGCLWVELASTVVRRLLQHRPLFGGDRNHVYDRMERAGMAKGRVTGLLVAGQAVLTGIAVGAARLGAPPVALVSVAVFVGGTVLAARPPATS